jgi:hypothetical protein
MRFVIVLFSCLIACVSLANAQTRPSLKVVVVRGQGAINNVAVGAVQSSLGVQVRDENDKPVDGASVTFLLPERGPGGTFLGTYNKLSLSTDVEGIATANTFQPNLIEGRFQIHVIATKADRTGDADISQTNVLQNNRFQTDTGNPGIITRLKSVKLSRRTKIIAAIAAGGLVALIATRGGSSSTSPTAVPGTSVIPGTVSVGAPR